MAIRRLSVRFESYDPIAGNDSGKIPGVLPAAVHGHTVAAGIFCPVKRPVRLFIERDKIKGGHNGGGANAYCDKWADLIVCGRELKREYF